MNSGKSLTQYVYNEQDIRNLVGLDSSLEILSRISKDGFNQSVQLQILLSSKSKVYFVESEAAISLREFLTSFIGDSNQILQNSSSSSTVTSNRHAILFENEKKFLNDISVAMDWFNIQIESWPENLNKKLKTKHFSIATTFLAICMIPIQLTHLRFMILESDIIDQFSEPMQTLLALQMAGSYILSEKYSDASDCLLNTSSIYQEIQNFPEYKMLELTIKVHEERHESLVENSIKLTNSSDSMDSMLSTNSEGVDGMTESRSPSPTYETSQSTSQLSTTEEQTFSPFLNSILNYPEETLRELREEMAPDQEMIEEVMKILGDEREKVSALKGMKGGKLPMTNSHIITLRKYLTWASIHEISPFPITLKKSILWAEIGLRLNGICTSQISRNIRELEWSRNFSFDLFDESFQVDQTSLWPQSIWKEFLSDLRFPLIYYTNGGGIRRSASKSHQTNHSNVQQHHQHELEASLSKPLEVSKNPKRLLTSGLYNEPIQKRKKVEEVDENDSSVGDLESESEVIEANPSSGTTSYIIPVQQPEEPVQKVDFRSFKKPKHIRRNMEAILELLRWESNGMIIDVNLFEEVFWNYRIEGKVPFEGLTSQPDIKRLVHKYLKFCYELSISSLPFTNVKLMVFLVKSMSHLSKSTAINYTSTLLCVAKKLQFMKFEVQGFGWFDPVLIEFKKSLIWKKWLQGLATKPKFKDQL
ncbi:uncharacterized protein MELLADRAFT_105621 [Melampsora larici-populina 98AG31]|uniref:Uncharacterized protein n=1 Tax=Melampsora larici-populina (strain 98AG31 / pathotype 3-4-7) TaxID=747676 RepID=F4RIT9_MELLP|nr:uncharacterized protein MELLADRAFT_105621 [Melampsora larici-populina 98AG31]EGG07775.1 hypothetical protein MELLADRAFT_105621 [Melampsora larici-populina 98AG31]